MKVAMFVFTDLSAECDFYSMSLGFSHATTGLHAVFTSFELGESFVKIHNLKRGGPGANSHVALILRNVQ